MINFKMLAEINSKLEKNYGCNILIKFNEVNNKLVVYKFDDKWKSCGQPSSWGALDIEHLMK
jgi:hypothetical protein